MKILLLTDGLYPFVIGGMQKHSSILIKLLSQHNLELVVLHPGGDDYSLKTLQAYFGQLSNVDFKVVSFPKKIRIPGHYVRSNKEYSKNCFLTVKDEINSFDLVYAQGFTGHYFLKNEIKKHLKPKVIVNLHGFEMFQFLDGFKMKVGAIPLKREALYNLNFADFVYSFGAKIDKILENLKIPFDKILHHSNGIESINIKTEIRNSQDIRKFIFIGRNERRKGYKEFKTAIQELVNVKCEFHFIGYIDDSDKINQSNVYYHGLIKDQNSLFAILDECDCIVVPSLSEGMPTVILEAMSRGLAVIATNVGASSVMIQDNGILIENSSPKNILAAIDKLHRCTNQELDAMKLLSLSLVQEKFTWDKVIESKIIDFEMITGQSISKLSQFSR